MFCFNSLFHFDIYRHHTNQVTGSRGNSQQAEPHIAVPTRESSTKEALFHISHIRIEYTFYRIPLEIKFNTRYTAVYICPLLNDIKTKRKQCALHGTGHLITSSWKQKETTNKHDNKRNGSGLQRDTTFIQVGATHQPSLFSSKFMKAFILFKLHTENNDITSRRRRSARITEKQCGFINFS